MMANFGRIIWAMSGVVISALASLSYAEAPSWALDNFHPSAVAYVSEVDFESGVGLVVLSGGAERGFREGALCEILRNGSKIGELVVAVSNADNSVGALLGNSDSKAGDEIRLKFAR